MREAASRSQYLKNMEQYSLACLTYYGTNGILPGAGWDWGWGTWQVGSSKRGEGCDDW